MANALSTRPTDAELAQLLRDSRLALMSVCRWPRRKERELLATTDAMDAAAYALEAAIVEAANAEAKYWARAQVAHDTTWIRNDDERADASEAAYNAALERGGSQDDCDAAAETAYDKCALRQRQAAEQEYQDNHR